MMNKTKCYTLWRTLQQHHVVIPIIQRDYAQGRKDDRKIEQIRKGFIKNLLDHLVQKSALELDFVYGALIKDELELLDGQQRLTTLFLLHWYVANRAKSLLQKSEIQDTFKKFTYKTRLSSKMFIAELLEHGHEINTHELAFGNRISTLIENEHWYLAVWKKDPTVISMLTVLDEIHQQFEILEKNLAIKASDMWHTLIEDQILCFYLLPMPDFHLSDELYIKMNARGVQLTEFENFKAWLQGYTDSSITIKNEFFNAIDLSWTDYIWTLKESLNQSIKDHTTSSQFVFDEMFIQLLKSSLICHSTLFYTDKNLKTAVNSYDKDEKSLVSRLRKNLIITTNEYEALLGDATSQSQWMAQISRLFAFLQDYHGKEKIKDVLANIFDSEHSSYEDQALFSILYFYSAYIDQASQFDDWFHVAKKLVNNAKGYFNAETDLITVIQAIKQFAMAIGQNNVLDTMRLWKKSDDIFKKLVTAFDEKHLEHEIEKANLIHENLAWKPLFRTYEQHPYFYGQIGFLIAYAKDDQTQAPSITLFEKYAKRASELFTEPFLKDNEYRLHRALLSISDKDVHYLIKDGSNYSFGRQVFSSTRQRNENWRKVFEDEQRRRILKKLLEQLSGNINFDVLEQIIANHLPQINDWRIYFLKVPKLIHYCQKYQIRFHHDNEIYLLSSRQMNGAHAELRTYALYLQLIDVIDQSELEYVSVSTSSVEPQLIFKPNHLPKLSVVFKNGKFMNSLEKKIEEVHQNQIDEDAELDLESEYEKILEWQQELTQWVEPVNALNCTA